MQELNFYIVFYNMYYNIGRIKYAIHEKKRLTLPHIN
nr:MAG TPA: hypothetical protein [Caudoviricetes sp.]